MNECKYVSQLSLPKNFNVNEKIDNIILFENLLGKVTSISLFSFQIDDKLLNFFNSKLYGNFTKINYYLDFCIPLIKNFIKPFKIIITMKDLKEIIQLVKYIILV